MRHLLLAAALGGLLLVLPTRVPAQNAEQRKQLSDIKKELSQVTTLIRDKDYDGAQEVVDAANTKAEEIAKVLGVPVESTKMQGVAELIEQKAESIEIARARAEGRPPRIGPSFSGEVAPIVSAKCLNCHGGNTPRAKLNLSTYAGWKQGGQSGRLLSPGASSKSLLMARLKTTDPRRRMPQNANALSAEELKVIAKWIDKGAKFDGSKEGESLAELMKTAALNDPNVPIPRPAGGETVSFTRDIAPFMANMCVRCHNEQRKSGGLSLVSFYDMMKGGDSGQVVVPGDRQGSRLFRLTGGIELPRMPNDNNVRITRKNFEDLKKWFDEGNKFDGDNPLTPLRVYATANTETPAARVAQMSPEELLDLRARRTADKAKLALPNDQFLTVQSDDFLVTGNVPSERLTQVDEWAREQLKMLQQHFGRGDSPVWKGKLAIYVLKDRFSYDEFNQVIEKRRVPRELTGHEFITPDYEDAYVCLLDVGDESKAEGGDLKLNLMDHLTAAFLRRDAASIPDWVLRGTGLALAKSSTPRDPYLQHLDQAAAQVLGVVLNPADVFNNGTFSPATITPVGATLVSWLIKARGDSTFARFVGTLRQGQTTEQAIRSVYNADLETLAKGYLSDVMKGKK